MRASRSGSGSGSESAARAVTGATSEGAQEPEQADGGAAEKLAHGFLALACPLGPGRVIDGAAALEVDLDDAALVRDELGEAGADALEGLAAQGVGKRVALGAGAFLDVGLVRDCFLA